jgi:predicted ester cyclase
MSEQNKALAKRWFEEVWNQGRESTIDELFHPQDKVYGFPEPDSVLIGPAGFKTIHRAFRSAFGSLHIDLDDLIAEGDRVAIRWTCTGTHTGADLGFPATGKKSRHPRLLLHRLSRRPDNPGLELHGPHQNDPAASKQLAPGRRRLPLSRSEPLGIVLRAFQSYHRFGQDLIGG